MYCANPRVRVVCAIVLNVLLLLTVFSLIINISGSTTGFLGSTINYGTTGQDTVLTITTINIIVNSSFSDNVVRITHDNIFVPSVFAFRRIVVLFLTIVLASIVLLSVFGAFKLPASAAMSLIFRLLKTTITITVISVIRSNNGLTDRLKTRVGDKGTLGVLANVFTSITVTFAYNAVIV